MKYKTDHSTINKDYELSTGIEVYFKNNLVDLFEYKIDFLIKRYSSESVDNLYRIFKYNHCFIITFLLKQGKITLLLHVLEHLSHEHRFLLLSFNNYEHLTNFIQDNSNSAENIEITVRPLIDALCKLEEKMGLLDFLDETLANLDKQPRYQIG